MKIVQRYIIKSVIASTALIFMIVMALNFVAGMLRELHSIGVGDYGFSNVVLHEFLMLPHDIYQFFPMLVLLGGVLGLGALVSSHELMVMRAAGVSMQRIVLSVISAAFMLIFIATFMGEFIAPRANFIAEKQKSLAQTVGQTVVTHSGIWVHEGNDFIHIDRVIGRHRLQGVTRYEFDNEHRMLVTHFAKSLEYSKGQWYAYDLNKTVIGQDKTGSQHVDFEKWDLKLTPNLLSVGMVDADAMSLQKLHEYANYLAENRLESSVFRLAFWQRIFQPLTTLVMILLAIPFVFIAPRATTMGKRILFAVMLSFIFYVLNAFFGEFSIVYRFPPLIAALLPTAFFLLGGFVWAWRTRTHAFH
jgi:lipopolysaccharide export system permease protein